MDNFKHLIENISATAGDILSNNSLVKIQRIDKNITCSFHIDAQKGVLSQEQKTQLGQQLQQALENSPEGIMIGDRKVEQNLLPAAEYNRDKDDDVDAFITTAIPQIDQSMWRVALLMANKMKSIVQKDRDEVARLKEQLSQYGARGRNIANLGSSNHLQTLIMPAYEGFLKTGEEGKKAFLKYYNDIVDHCPTAVFVHIFETDAEILEETIRKVKGVRKYNQNEVCVFGAGKTNWSKIETLKDSLQENQEDLRIEQFNFTNQNGATKLSIIIKKQNDHSPLSS